MDLRQSCWNWRRSGSQTEVLEMVLAGGEVDLRSQISVDLRSWKWYLLEESGSQIELLELVLTGGEVGLSQGWCSWYLLEEKWVSARAGGASICLKRSGSRIGLLGLVLT